MRTHALPLLLLLASCAVDRPIDMELVLPKQTTAFDTSCVTAVEVHAIGLHYDADPKDIKTSCLPVTGQATVADIRAAISGRFELKLPDTGLAGVEVYGWSGPSPCERPDGTLAPSAIFYASEQYIGQDTMQLQTVPNVACATSEIKLQPVDIFALTSGAAPSSANCATAVYTDPAGATPTTIGVGTMMPKLFGRGADMFVSYGNQMQGALADIQAPQQVLSNKSCLAAIVSNAATEGGISSCLVPSAVCAPAGANDAPFSLPANDQKLGNLDPTLVSKFPTLTTVAVWDNASPKHTIAGATASVDPQKGTVVYIDAAVTKLADQSKTGPSGLFVVFSKSLIDVQIAANGKTRTVTIGSPTYGPGAVNVVLQ